MVRVVGDVEVYFVYVFLGVGVEEVVNGIVVRVI